MEGGHKAVWMVIICAFLVIEILAITEAQNDQNDKFTAIGKGIEATISNSDKEFKATMDKESKLLDETKTVAGLAKTNLETISGDGAIPCVVPQSHAVFNGAVPLVVWNRGTNPLTGVEVRLLSRTEFFDQASIFYKRAADLGTLRDEWPKPLPEGVTPIPGNDGIASYTAEIWTQNGYYTEVIQFRRGKYALPWAYRYWLERQFVTGAKPTKTEIKVQDLIRSKCGESSWSDDLGDGKPITQR